jgi:hypothetical protein
MKTKNGRVFMGLAGFAEAVDCAPANNGLKRRTSMIPKSGYRFSDKIMLRQ